MDRRLSIAETGPVTSGVEMKPDGHLTASIFAIYCTTHTHHTLNQGCAFLSTTAVVCFEYAALEFRAVPWSKSQRQSV